MTNSRLIYCYDPTGKATSYFLALDAMQNLTGNDHNILRPTPFRFEILRLNDDLSFYVQKVFLNDIEFTRVIFVDKITPKPLASLPGLEINTHSYCEIGAVTEFISNDAAAFYYVDPSICDIDKFFATRLMLQINSQFYQHKKELFIGILNEYRKMYIRDELYSSQLVCDWINWSINNITSGIWAPINEFQFDNGTEATNVDTVIVNDVVSNELLLNKMTSNKVMTYAAVAAAAPRAIQSKAVITNKPIVFSNNNKPAQKLEPKLITTEKSPKKQSTLQKIDMPTDKPKKLTLNSPATTPNKFSFSSLVVSSDDESEDENVPHPIKTAKNKNVKRKNTNIISKKPQHVYNEDQFLDEVCAQLNLIPKETSVATLSLEEKTQEELAKILRKAAANRSEALSFVAVALCYLLVTPPLLNQILDIIYNSWSDVDSNDRIKNPFVFAAFSALYISQVVCALFAAKQLANGSKVYANNHPAFNPVLFGYLAAKQQNKSNEVMRLEDNMEKIKKSRGMKL